MSTAYRDKENSKYADHKKRQWMCATVPYAGPDPEMDVSNIPI